MAPAVDEHAERARESFNRRFWYAEGGYLYDVSTASRATIPRAGRIRSSRSRSTIRCSTASAGSRCSTSCAIAC